MIVLAFAIAAGAQLISVSTDTAPPVPIVSVEHVRAALARPPSTLILRERPPDFRVDIIERERFERLVAPILDFTVGPPIRPMFPAAPGPSAPLFTINLTSYGMAAAQGVAKLQRARAKRAARDEVRRTILAYCAVQPNGGAGIQICASSRAAIR